jgi:hypothetical protein
VAAGGEIDERTEGENPGDEDEEEEEIEGWSVAWCDFGILR